MLLKKRFCLLGRHSKRKITASARSFNLCACSYACMILAHSCMKAHYLYENMCTINLVSSAGRACCLRPDRNASLACNTSAVLKDFAKERQFGDFAVVFLHRFHMSHNCVRRFQFSHAQLSVSNNRRGKLVSRRTKETEMLFVSRL